MMCEGERTRCTHVRFCSRCGNEAPQELLFTHFCYEDDWAMDGEPLSVPTAYYMVRCSTCGGLLCYVDYGAPSEHDFGEATIVWPQSRVDAAVPRRIARIYEEALRIKRTAPNAFATQIRRALEAVCEDRDAKEGTLAKRLETLAMRGELPPLVNQLADTLRSLGNLGAHAESKCVEPWQVDTIDNLFQVVITYIYVAPSQLLAFKRSFDEASQRDEEDRE